MYVTQISVFIENRPGSLVAVTEVLAQSEVDITALSLADTSEFGILRLIVDKPDAAQEALRKAGLIVKSTEVLAVAMDDKPGGLSSILRLITNAGLSIEYLYAFVGKIAGKAVVVMQVSNRKAALDVLIKEQKTIVTAQDIYNM